MPRTWEPCTIHPMHFDACVVSAVQGHVLSRTGCRLRDDVRINAVFLHRSVIVALGNVSCRERPFRRA